MPFTRCIGSCTDVCVPTSSSRSGASQSSAAASRRGLPSTATERSSLLAASPSGRSLQDEVTRVIVVPRDSDAADCWCGLWSQYQWAFPKDQGL